MTGTYTLKMPNHENWEKIRIMTEIHGVLAFAKFEINNPSRHNIYWEHLKMNDDVFLSSVMWKEIYKWYNHCNSTAVTGLNYKQLHFYISS